MDEVSSRPGAVVALLRTHNAARRGLAVGRSPECDVVVNHRSVSRRHAEVWHGAGGWHFRDLGSTNGSYVNGVPVGVDYRVLRGEEIVQIGQVVLCANALTGAISTARPRRPRRRQPSPLTLPSPSPPRRLVQGEHQLVVKTMAALTHALDYRDRYTRRHSQRIAHYALALAQQLDLAEADRTVLMVGALLHDIGKIAVAEAILCKPGAER